MRVVNIVFIFYKNKYLVEKMINVFDLILNMIDLESILCCKKVDGYYN